MAEAGGFDHALALRHANSVVCQVFYLFCIFKRSEWGRNGEGMGKEGEGRGTNGPGGMRGLCRDSSEAYLLLLPYHAMLPCKQGAADDGKRPAPFRMYSSEAR